MLAQLQSMTAALGVNVQAAEVARQVPIASTLAVMNLGQTRNLLEGVLPEHQAETKALNIRNEKEELGLESLRNASKMMNITSTIALDALESGGVQEAMKAAEIAKYWAGIFNSMAKKSDAQRGMTESLIEGKNVTEVTEAKIRTEIEKYLADQEANRLKAHKAKIGMTPTGEIRKGDDASPSELEATLGIASTKASTALVKQQARYVEQQAKAISSRTGLDEDMTAAKLKQMNAELNMVMPIYNKFIEEYPNNPRGALQQLSDFQAAQGGKFPNYYSVMARLADRVTDKSLTEVERDDALADYKKLKNIDHPQIAAYEYLSALGGESEQWASVLFPGIAGVKRELDKQAYHTMHSWGWGKYDKTMQVWEPLLINDYEGLFRAGYGTWGRFENRTEIDASYAAALTKIEREHGEGLAAGLVLRAVTASSKAGPKWITDRTQRVIFHIINQTPSVVDALTSKKDTVPHVVIEALGMFRRYISDDVYKNAHRELRKTMGSLVVGGEITYNAAWKAISETTSTIKTEMDKYILEKLSDIMPRSKPVQPRRPKYKSGRSENLLQHLP